MIAFLVHYGTHFLVPIIIAYFAYREKFKQVLLILWGAIIIDVDHLLATPIFAPERCSLFFHPLHSVYAIIFYMLLLLPSKTRVFGIALCLHMIADGLDCLL